MDEIVISDSELEEIEFQGPPLKQEDLRICG
jgi:hypothetical protein